MDSPNELRALYAPMPGGGILLPGSTIAEVIDFVEPRQFSNAPDWLLGELSWKGRQLPLVHLALLTGGSPDASVPARSRVLVVRTLAEVTSVLHLGFVISGLPKLKTVTAGNLAETNRPAGSGVFSYVTLDGAPAVIPDLEVLARTIEQAVYRNR